MSGGGGDSFLFIKKKTMYWYSYIVYPEYFVVGGGGDGFQYIVHLY